MSTGVLAQAALINSIYKCGLSLTTQVRKVHTEAGLVSHLSTDISRIDFLFQWAHLAWTVPIQIIMCVIILCTQMGPSALAGLSLFVLLTPIQLRTMSVQLKIRRDSMQYTDQRAGLLQEYVIRSIDFFPKRSIYAYHIQSSKVYASNQTVRLRKTVLGT